MKEDSITELLNHAQLLETKRLQKVEEERKRGEWFNVFNVLGVSTDEVRTHSAFIAELLNPQGSHGCGDEFLKAFIEVIPGLNGFDIETIKAKTQVELSIGQIDKDYTEGGRLDIIVHTETHAIIIENKIYAGDQYNQLLRYHKYAESRYKNNNRILYLTLDGGSPSDESKGEQMEEGKDFYSISYASDITNWLQHCIAIAVNKPLVRETLFQYLNLIKQLTNQTMEQNDKKELFELLTQYPEATSSILSTNMNEYIHFLYERFVLPRLKVFVEENSLLYFEMENLWSGERHKGFCFRRINWQKYAIWIYSEYKGLVNFYDGISTLIGVPCSMKQSKLDCMKGKSNDYWPYGFTYLKYKTWDARVISDMIDKDGHNRFAETIIDRIKTILEEVESKQLPEKDNW